jgi:hypothetical protein
VVFLSRPKGITKNGRREIKIMKKIEKLFKEFYVSFSRREGK